MANGSMDEAVAPAGGLTPDERKGIAFGLAMALAGGAFLVSSRAGALTGFRPDDLTFLRFAVAGLALLPALLRAGLHNLGGVGWRRGCALALGAGPFFSLLQTGGFQFAPLGHGALIAPAALTLFSILLAVLVLGEALSAPRLLGMALVVAGLVLIGFEGLAAKGGEDAWVGHLLWCAAGFLWAVYTILLRLWRLDAIRAMTAVSVLSFAAATPVYLATGGLQRLAALPVADVVLQAVGQGLCAGLILALAYSRSVILLGAARAAVFPSIVPGVALALGAALLGEFPNVTQIVGLLVITLGLIFALGLVRSPRRGG
jgi:drug/metabolite transporter (DMT)-like permease